METNDLFEVLKDRLTIEISHDTSHEGHMTYIDSTVTLNFIDDQGDSHIISTSTESVYIPN